MQTSPMRLRPLSAILLLLLPGCREAPTRPLDEALHLTLSISSSSGDPAHPIRIRAQIQNRGGRTVTYSEGCVADDFRIVVRDPGRRAVEFLCQQCPNRVCPACPDGIIPLAPRESVTEEITFSGTLADCDGSFLGPSGTYNVEAFFSAWSAGENQLVTISRATIFDWSAQAAD